MGTFIVVDYGASRLKCGVFDTETQSLVSVKSHPSPDACVFGRRIFEISPDELFVRFKAVCGSALDSVGGRADGILLSCQQHGFLVLDENGVPVTNYISWKDERALNPLPALTANESDVALPGDLNGAVLFEKIKKETAKGFSNITGMKLRAGFPFVNFIHAAFTADLPRNCRVMSLPEWLAHKSGCFNGLVHETMAAGLGFYDISEHEFSGELVRYAEELTGRKISFGAPVRSVEKCAEFDGVPLYCGCGDHQCAVLGAGNRPAETLSINIGTGSQVSAVAVKSSEAETRPYFDCMRMATITHIPAGRALTEFLRPFETGADVWGLLGSLSAQKVLDSTLRINLAFFDGAFGYRDGGSIGNIYEGGFTLENYAASLVRSMAEQYALAAGKVDTAGLLGKCVISGGVPRKIPALAEAVAEMLRMETVLSPHTEEALFGLGMLAGQLEN
ncbi:MAG: FGGY family carbohydrate kinase [Elusimicrobiaceae bacterium]